MKKLMDYLLRKHRFLRISTRFVNDENYNRIAINRFRHELALCGHYTNNISDKDMTDVICGMCEMIDAMCFTDNDIANAIVCLAKIR